MLAASDGNIYTALCTHNGKDAAVLVRFEPDLGTTRKLADMGAATAKDGKATIPQGKVHTRMGQGEDGRIWCATHPTYPPGLVPDRAPSGHVVCYNPITGDCRSIARAPEREAIITAAFDMGRNVMVGLSNPSGRLLVCDLTGGAMRDLGPQTNGGSPCRTIGIDGEGSAWFTREPGEIVRLHPGAGEVDVMRAKLPHPNFAGEPGMAVWRTVSLGQRRGPVLQESTRGRRICSRSIRSSGTRLRLSVSRSRPSIPCRRFASRPSRADRTSGFSPSRRAAPDSSTRGSSCEEPPISLRSIRRTNVSSITAQSLRMVIAGSGAARTQWSARWTHAFSACCCGSPPG